ncbi:dual specificity phosphatase [Achlya hypogyna]|uniref:protein-tyrosine-phosphatase n=1 Tax=Achlya hypogyna TaxID=1202772 RepID=A0A1V9YK77_ACHHY|nr:dual specificity phosphatase [Achlya hypogyna]
MPATTAVRLVSSQWLYNRLQTLGGLTLLDTRSEQCYEHAHVWSFINLPPPPHTGRGLFLENSSSDAWSAFDLDSVAPASAAAKERWDKRKLTDVVLYDAFGVYTPTSWAMTLATWLVQERLVSSVKLLTGGMQSFQRMYPFMMTTRKDVASATPVRSTIAYTPTSSSSAASSPDVAASPKVQTHALTFPHEILQGAVYLGNVWQASTPEVLRKMGITYVVSVTTLPMDEQARLKGITYHHVPMDTFMAAPAPTLALLRQAQATGAKVLVHCVHGISASAALVVHYVMHAHKTSLVTAYNHVLRCRNLIYPNPRYMRWLVQAEIARYGAPSVSSVLDIDDLQNGLLPDSALNPQDKLSVQLALLFRRKCSDKLVATHMQSIFG